MLLPAASPARIALVAMLGFLAPKFAASRVAATYWPNFRLGFVANAARYPLRRSFAVVFRFAAIPGWSLSSLSASWEFCRCKRARSSPASERPFERSDAVLRPVSARPLDRSDDVLIPLSTPTPLGGPPPRPPADEPPPPPPPRPRPWAEAITWRPAISRNTNPNFAIIFNVFRIAFPPSR